MGDRDLMGNQRNLEEAWGFRRNKGVFTICFDFPEQADPIFAGWTKDGALGFASTLDTCARFETEKIAERTLRNSYGPSIHEWGAVVEVEA